MMFYNINEFRSGLKIMHDGEPCVIMDSIFVKPGKGQAFNRVKLRKLITGKVMEKIFKSGASVEAADVVGINLTYMYNDGEFWYFMNNENFEQLTADAGVVGDNFKWLVEQIECVLTLWNGRPITMTPPNFVELEIINTNPSMKGDTVSSSGKIAILNTGAIIKVPLFVQIGEVIRVNTHSGEYVSRVK